MVDQDALDEAIRRFPWRLQKLRLSLITPKGFIEKFVEDIRAEYRLLLKDKEKAKQYE
jgi:hypothetical protein